MKYRTINGKFASSNIAYIISRDLQHVITKCTLIQNGYYRLYKIPDIDHLIPLAYGRYKISQYDFPLYILENKYSKQLQILTTQSLVDSISSMIKYGVKTRVEQANEEQKKK